MKVFKVTTAILLVALSVSIVAASTSFNDLVINTEGGPVQGIEERTSLLGDRYFSWKGIPYAEPPVGDLRFRDPVAHRGWSGTWDASEHGNTCPTGSGGDEDCLFLNVYSTNVIGKRPVMFWIHGGAFIMGDGNDGTYGPEHFIPEDVVYVTINYRVGILGFLSTEDEHAPGNYGMKDMVMALQWVRNNIANFGGDPEQITIFGESAGGVAVHLLLLSPLSTGLFHQAISMSGTALSSWTLQMNPLSVAEDLSRNLGLTYSGTGDMVRQLRTLPASALTEHNPSMMDLPYSRGIASPLTWVPTIDPENYSGTKFLPRHPRDIMISGDFMDVPLIIGYTSDESLFMIREQILDGAVRDTLNANRTLAVPTTPWDVNPHSAAGQAISNAFWQHYMDNQDLTVANRYEWSKFNTDVHFVWGVDQCIRYHLRHKTSPIYYYVFSYDGAFNMVKRMLLLSSFPGAMHADDLGYLFPSSIPALPSNHAHVVRRRLVRLWTDFSKYGNPTPTTDSLITTIWPRVASNMEYLDIGEELVSGTNPHGDRMQLWNDLYNAYVAK